MAPKRAPPVNDRNALPRLSRIIAAILLAVPILGVGAGAYAAPSDPRGVADVAGPSRWGAFLSGREAGVDRRYDLAAQYFLEALESDWDNPMLVERAFLTLIAAGEISRGKALAQRLVELDPGHELANIVLGAVDLAEGRLGPAADRLAKLDTSTLLGISANVLAAWAMIGDGRADEALDLVGSIDQEGLAEFLRFHRALMAGIAGDDKMSLDLLQAAYESDPLVFRIVEAYARALANAGQFDRAREVIDSFRAEGLFHPLIGEVADAINKDVAPGPFIDNVQQGAAEMLLGLGNALGSDTVSDLAIVFMRLALYLSPDAEVVSMSLADMLERGGRYDEANQVYDTIPVDSPLRMSAVIGSARNLEELGERAEAIRTLRNIIALHPDNMEANETLGDLLRADEQYEAAAEAYTRVIEVAGGDKPAAWRYFYLRGIAYERARIWDKAEPDFLKALELNPDQPQVLNYLGYSWVDKGLNLDEALQMIQTAVDLRPTDGYIIDSLGWAYHRLGRNDEAVETLERAARLMPDDPTINDHLGDAFWRVGRKLEARFQWTIARDLGPEEPGQLDAINLKLEVGLDAALEQEHQADAEAAE